MRNPRKIFHFLLVWGMVPLIVWSGCPALGCACATTAVEPASCGCCVPEKAQAKKPCCCRANEPSKHLGTSSIGSIAPPSDLGLLSACSCGRNAAPSAVILETERKSLGEDLIVRNDGAFATIEPDPPVPEAVVDSPVPPVDSDRVILFRAFLI